MVVSIGSRGSHIPAMTPRRKRLFGVIAGMWDPLDPIETTMTLIAVNISLIFSINLSNNNCHVDITQAHQVLICLVLGNDSEFQCFSSLWTISTRLNRLWHTLGCIYRQRSCLSFSDTIGAKTLLPLLYPCCHSGAWVLQGIICCRVGIPIATPVLARTKDICGQVALP